MHLVHSNLSKFGGSGVKIFMTKINYLLTPSFATGLLLFITANVKWV